MPESNAATLMSVEEYRRSAFEVDVDYVDGQIEERNVGEGNHSRLQNRIGAYLVGVADRLRGQAYTEMRVQVSPTRFRVPDLCLDLMGDPYAEVLTTPPFLVIEILSREDRVSRVLARLKDYQSFGIPHIFVVDPAEKTSYRYVAIPGNVLLTDNPEISIDLVEMFRQSVRP
jgi:Uma2 family endonuclease